MPQTYRFESKSSSGTFHETIVADDGTLSCSCRGFLYSRTTPKECTHTRGVLDALASGKPVSKTLTNVNTSPVQPMLASSLPEDRDVEDYDPAEWTLEEKFDGHRLIIQRRLDGATAWSRQGNVREIPQHVLTDLQAFAPGIYDSELLVRGGTATDVKDLSKQGETLLMLFDLLEVDGRTTLSLPAWERHTLLCATQEGGNVDSVVVVAQFEPSASTLRSIWSRGGEGAILKKRMAPYAPGKRSKNWVKLKRYEPAELTIVGFAEGRFGPASITLLRDDAGEFCSVKTKDAYWRGLIEASPSSLIGRRLAIECQGRASQGGYKSPMWDHLVKDDEKEKA